MVLCGRRLHRAQRLQVHLVRSRSQAFVSFCCECGVVVVTVTVGHACIRRWTSGLSVVFGCCEQRAVSTSVSVRRRSRECSFTWAPWRLFLEGEFVSSLPLSSFGVAMAVRAPASQHAPQPPAFAEPRAAFLLGPGARPAVSRPLSELLPSPGAQR